MQFTPPRVPCTVPRGETAGSSDPAAVGEGWRAEGRRLVQDASRVHTLFLLARVSPDLTGSKCRAINQSAGRNFGSRPNSCPDSSRRQLSGTNGLSDVATGCQSSELEMT